MKSTDAQIKLFEGYIGDKKIVIADTSAVSRTMIASFLHAMGAKTANIVLASTYAEAEAEIDRVKPRVVLCDYDMGHRKCGLDLLQKQRLHYPESKDNLFVMVTSNTSQSAVARAAEEDVDTYVLKPFTGEILRAAILRAALTKIRPTEYLQAIERGKDQLAQGELKKAAAEFERAKGLDPAPSLACFYLGQTQLIQQVLDGAEGSYNEGLRFNKIHYKCLVGLYEVLMARKKHHDAYDIVRRISHYFPANPQRLTAVLRLAVLTQSYEDVERYYRIFTSLDERNEEIIKYICAALVVCGKYYLQQNLGSRAIELFQKAAVTASGRTRILREIITALVEAGLPKQCDEFLKRFPPESKSGADYLAMSLLYAEQTLNPSIVITKGRDILSKGVHDPVVYEVLIRRSVASGLLPAAQDLAHSAIQRWPDQKGHFEWILKGDK